MAFVVLSVILMSGVPPKIVPPSVAAAEASLPPEVLDLPEIPSEPIEVVEEEPEPVQNEESPAKSAQENPTEQEETADETPDEEKTLPEERLLLRPLTQLAGLAEQDTPIRAVTLIGEEIFETDPVVATVDLFDILLGPVREANYLLPKKLDPLSGEEPRPLIPRLRDKPSEEFKPSDQRRRLGSSLAIRDDTPNESAKWRWQISAGGSFRQGNTSNSNIHGQFSGQRRSDLAVMSGKIGVNYNRNNDAEPNRRTSGEFVIDRNLRGRWIWYGKDEAEYDQARLIDLRNVASTGLGFKFIDELDRRLVARTGPTVSQILYAPGANNDDESQSGWLLESEFRQLIAETIRIQWTTSAFPNFDSEQQFRIRSDAALLFPIGGSAWHWKFGLRHDYQLDPVAETNESDVEGYFSITYSK